MPENIELSDFLMFWKYLTLRFPEIIRVSYFKNIGIFFPELLEPKIHMALAIPYAQD